MVLCGAGLSMAPPSNLPSAKEVSRACHDRYCESVDPNFDPNLRDDLEALAEHFAQLGTLITVFIREVVPWLAFKKQWNLGHEAIADFLYCRAVCATPSSNYDDLIELFGRMNGAHIDRSLDGDEATVHANQHSPLLKFHGCSSDKDHTVWTKSQINSDSPERWHDVFERGSKIVRRSMGGSFEELDRILSGARRLTSRGQRFHPYRKNQRNSSELDKWLIDTRLCGFVQHESRSHIAEDIWRYTYCSFYASKNRGDSPRTRDFPGQLAADHKNWKSGNFADRFKVQAKGKPASTVTSHISKDGHYYIHYDPSQSRSLTVREAARLQTFPDIYFFEGTRTQQYVQIGNAVPPWLARQIAEIVYDVLS